MDATNNFSRAALAISIIATTSMPILNTSFTNDEGKTISIVKLSSNKSTRLLNSESFNLDKLKLNKLKLNTFKSFSRGWDNYDGIEIDEKTINIVNGLLSELTFQPQIFPTARGTIQVEKYFSDTVFYEIEIDKDEIDAYIVNGEKEFEDNLQKDELITLISEMYI